jgi:hypothetical protein
MRIWAGMGAVALAIAAFGCKGEEVKVNINCNGAKDGMQCKLTRTAGESKVKTCWDIAITCNNGTAVSGSACQELAKGEASADHLMPESSFAGMDKCDGAKTTEVKNLKLTAE